MGKIEKHKSVKGERGFVKSRHVIFWGLGFFEKGEGQKKFAFLTEVINSRVVCSVYGQI